MQMNRAPALLMAAVVWLAPANPALADNPLMAFFERHGCTIGPESREAAIAEGFAHAAVDALAETALAAGDARRQRDWIVLDRSICTIRLPEITSDVSADSPEIRAIAPYRRDAFEIGGEEIVNEGCFLDDPFDLFTMLEGGDRDEGNAAYIAFVAAGIISGDVRFYAPSPLSTPAGFQLTQGACARAPGMEAINRSHSFIASGFGDYVRALGELEVCNGGSNFNASAFTAEMQGVDPLTMRGLNPQPAPEAQEPINAWLFFEFDLITMAAGWHAGFSATNRGAPRPPLCHYE